MNNESWKPFDIVKGISIACGVLFAFYLIYLLRTPLTWIFIALFLSLALDPLVATFERWMPRGWAILVVLLGLVGSMALIVILLLPPLLQQGSALVDAAPGWFNKLKQQVSTNSSLQHWEHQYHLIDKLKGGLGNAGSHAGDIFGGALGVAGEIFKQMLGAVTILVMTVFMLASGPRWRHWIVEQAPKSRQEKWHALTKRMSQAVSGYVLGNILISVLCGLSSWVVLLILNVPYSGALALIVALLDLIPLVGATLGAVAVGLVTLFIDFPTASIVWLVWTIAYQQLENHLLQPQIYRRTVDVHPLLVVIAILFGATLMGILGALIALPVAASIQVLLGNWWHESGRQQLLGKAEA